MNLGFDLSLPFFELYEVNGDPSAYPSINFGGFPLYALPSNKILPRDKIPFHPLMNLNMEKEIVFYGGSFNPWHEGHQACIDLLPRDKQLVIVIDRNPQKDLTQVDPFEKWAELVNSVKIHDELVPRDIYPGFLLKEKANPTIEWMKYLKLRHSKTPASLMIGFDQLKNFKTWTRVDELAPLIHKLYVVSREENENDFSLLKEEIETSLKIEIIHLGHHDHEKVSSTQIRNS